MLGRLVPDTQRTAKLIEEISAASREQSAGAVQVNSAIQQLDKVIHHNTAATEPMAASSRELASRAEQLQSAIGYLRLSSPRNRRGVLCMSSQADEMISAATH